MTTVKKMLISFTAGAILGMLYAPAKGVKTRRRLKSIGSDIKQGWNNIADSITDRIDNVADNAIDRIEITEFEVNDKAGYL